MSRKKRKFAKVSEVKFQVGDIIQYPEFGRGVIKKIEVNEVDFYDFFYFTDFARKGGDGTKVWLPKLKTEKQATLLMRDNKPVT